MGARRVDPNRVKLHFSYTAGELADRLGVHKNTVRYWQQQGLEPIDRGRPLLFQGAHVRDFLSNRKASRKRPCGVGELYCLRCREPRGPAGGMVDYIGLSAGSGNLRALCERCDTIMHRRVRRDRIAAVMPGLEVQFTQVPPRLSESTSPSLNCDAEKDGER